MRRAVFAVGLVACGSFGTTVETDAGPGDAAAVDGGADSATSTSDASAPRTTCGTKSLYCEDFRNRKTVDDVQGAVPGMDIEKNGAVHTLIGDLDTEGRALQITATAGVNGTTSGEAKLYFANTPSRLSAHARLKLQKVSAFDLLGFSFYTETPKTTYVYLRLDDAKLQIVELDSAPRVSPVALDVKDGDDLVIDFDVIVPRPPANSGAATLKVNGTVITALNLSAASGSTHYAFTWGPFSNRPHTTGVFVYDDLVLDAP